MRLDYLTIFPEYLAPLRLSLPGKAIDAGLVEIGVHDLRKWAHDRHHTVDDSPYGGGAGMVMKPEPFGHAFDDLQVQASDTIIFTSPSGQPFTQAVAAELSGHSRLIFCCGRYEGIDQRVIDHAGQIAQVREISLGDYVLNGGEVAALAITEAVVRLLPGFMGNPASLVEESHAEGLLEYPVYTKPATWHGHRVPEVLLSGDHAKIEAWRGEQAVRRTAERRPDLVHPSNDGDWEIVAAVPGDAGELLTLQRACWVQQAQSDVGSDVAPLSESLTDVRRSLAAWQTWVVRSHGRLIGAVRGRLDAETWEIGRLMVAPDLQGRGLGRRLLEHIQAVADPAATSFRLAVGAGSTDDLRMYRRAGFRVGRPRDAMVWVTKPR